jgi:hypothetical protein
MSVNIKFFIEPSKYQEQKKFTPINEIKTPIIPPTLKEVVKNKIKALF